MSKRRHIYSSFGDIYVFIFTWFASSLWYENDIEKLRKKNKQLQDVLDHKRVCNEIDCYTRQTEEEEEKTKHSQTPRL